MVDCFYCYKLYKYKPIKIDKSKIPHREWTWNHSEKGHEGVHTFDNKFVWYVHSNETRSKSVSFAQEYSDFIREGPPGESIPADVLVELYELVFSVTDDMIE